MAMTSGASGDGAMFREIVERFPEGVAVLDDAGRYVYLNQLAERIIGRPAAELVGKIVWDVMPSVVGNPFHVAFQRVVANGGEERYLHWYEPWKRWFEDRLTRLDAGLVLATFRDVTEAREREVLRERLLGILGHDLRTPLSAILVVAERILHRSVLSEDDREGAELVTRNARRMQRMIVALLDFTRSRLGGGLPIRREPTDLADVCREAAANAELGRLGRRIDLDVAPTAPGVWDPDRLAQVVDNLLRNALDHGDPSAPVSLSLRLEPSAAVIEVTNRGAPIASDRLGSIFDPFASAAPGARRGGGLGLGLFIVHEIVAAHGGSVALSSSEALGTTVTVRLPRA
jgi:PAS domain S-box-containing protein